MPAPEILLAFFATAFILGLVPGPDNIFVLTQSAAEGRRAGIIVTFGLLTGLLFHTAAVALGISVIFQTSPFAFTLLKIFGICYLLYLAWGAFRASKAKISSGNSKILGSAALYHRGIIMNISNPKISIFFLAFLPQFTDPKLGNIPIQIITLGIVFIIATALVFCSVAYLAGSLGDILRKSPKTQIILNRIAGIVFIALALKLAITSNK